MDQIPPFNVRKGKKIPKIAPYSKEATCKQGSIGAKGERFLANRMMGSVAAQNDKTPKPAASGGHSTIEKDGFHPGQLTKTKAKMDDPELQRIHKAFRRKS